MKKADREKIFNKYNGRCAYCGCELTDKWQVDHGISKSWARYSVIFCPNGVGHPDNHYPACAVCNHYKRSHCIESTGSHIGFRDFMRKFHIRLKRVPKNPTTSKGVKYKEYMLRVAEKYNITPDKPFDGVFYFEKFKTV